MNFLAELHEKGYQYQSLNSYRSAISSVHKHVEGVPIGQHPLVSRVLKGAFNERPPQPKYSSFWDVGQVLTYLRDLGSNDKLTLQQLTLKLVMLMALTRPYRSADLSQLNINHHSFSPDGVNFCPAHLSKQSKHNKPLSDFFFPSFGSDRNLCPVATLKEYENRTAPFRIGSGFSRLFLSLVGKHNPVTSSTIARWLKTCLKNAGIDTAIF